VEEITILFQEVSVEDHELSKKYNVNYVGLKDNIGIGHAFKKLAKYSSQKYFLTIEHDFNLIEDTDVTYQRLLEGINFLEEGFDAIRYRSRRDPGFPNFSEFHKGNELNYFDEWHQVTSPHLLDSMYWLDPSIEFSDKIQKNKDWFVTTSRWATWTNNPVMYKTEKYLEMIEPFLGEGIQLEEKIAYWWCRQNFNIAMGEGLFKHYDYKKYGQ